MSNPPNPPYGQNPYGNEPPGNQPPYGAPPPSYPTGQYGDQPAAPKNDGVSIASFITGLVGICLPIGVIGVILGFFGISRTKNGQRRGRWAAVTGIVLGALGTLVWIGLIVGGVWIFENTIRPDNAEVGQCVDIESDGGEVSMLKKDCTEDHDGEVVGVEKVTDENREAIETTMDLYCQEAVAAEDLEVINAREDLDLGAIIEDPDNIDTGDTLVCYVESNDGKLDEKILE